MSTLGTLGGDSVNVSRETSTLGVKRRAADKNRTPSCASSAWVSVPMGMWLGEQKVCTLDVCVLVTWRAAWISSFITTRTPRPRAASADATRAEPSRLAMPSADGASLPRIAPVTTTGLPFKSMLLKHASRKNAVSSSVSVPCTTTAPEMSLFDNCSIMCERSANIKAGVTCADGMFENCVDCMAHIFRNAGIDAVSSSPDTAGTSMPSAFVRMAIVPPVKMMVIFFMMGL